MENGKSENQRTEEIKEVGKVITKSGINAMTIMIIGQIEGHVACEAPAKSTKYEHVIPELVLADRSEEIDGVLVILNTVGGDVEAGLAIAEMIRGMKKPTVSLVLGGGHSIGIPLAVSARRSFIVPSATMTVHPVRINGLVLGTVQSWEYFRKMQDRINGFIIENSNISPEKLAFFMNGRSDMATDVGTILEGKEAVEAGLIDSVGGFSEAMDALEDMVKRQKRDFR